MPPAPFPTSSTPLPFSLFASLVEHIGAVRARKKGVQNRAGELSKQQQLLAAWTRRVKEEHGKDLPEGTVVSFFRLFFPEEGVRRRYGLQEKLLAEQLESLFRVSSRGTFARWNIPSYGATSAVSGCLGEEVRRWMEKKGKGKGKGGELTLDRVDELLDELASSSSYSADDVRALRFLPSFRPRTVTAILTDLFLPLSPFEVSLMIQILLRDISPLLYPPPSASGDVALAKYTSAAYDQIGVHQAMREWHPKMGRMYQAVADLDWCARQVEEAIRLRNPLPPALPRIGLPVKIPKTEKPGPCSRATKFLDGPVAVETKYDGERLQVHIDLSRPHSEQIQIFSKSGRDSTQTRRLLLPIIRASLFLPLDPLSSSLHPLLHKRLFNASSSSHYVDPPSKLILEGEMVPYDESRHCIDEFWKLDCAKVGAENPPTCAFTGGGKRGRGEESHETGQTGATPSPRYTGAAFSPIEGAAGGVTGTELHLMVVWFDLLVVEEESLLEEPYELRRAHLESLVRPIEGFCQLSESITIDFSHSSSALLQLRWRFAHVIAERCEGLMLKPLSSRYNDFRKNQRWVKLKKDFIPGAGDTLDFQVIGASWEKQRGRELLVPPSVWTTFFVGLAAPELGPYSGRSSKQHYHVLFSVSYGLSREQLAKLCHEIRQAEPERFELDFLSETAFREVGRSKRRTGMAVYESASTNYTFSLAPGLRAASTRPSIMFRKPRVMELNGAGFQRAHGSPYYELRFPRITKPSRPDSSGSPLSLLELQHTAQSAMSAAPTTAASEIAAIWGGGGSEKRKWTAGESEEEKLERETREWVGRLEKADGILEGNGGSVPDAVRRFDARPPLEQPQVEERQPHPLLSRPRSPPPPVSTSPLKSPPTRRPPLLPTTPPRAFSQPQSWTLMSRSNSSPCARSDAPSPPTQIADLPRPRRHLQLAALSPSASLPELSAVSSRPAAKTTATFPPTTCKKRRRLAYGANDLSRRSSMASLTATISKLLPPASSPAAVANANPAEPSETSGFTWSLYPPPSTSDALPIPRHYALDASNYLSSPSSVLWVAGLSPPSFSSSLYLGPPRQGFVFVDDDVAGEEGKLVEWLQREADAGRCRGSGGDQGQGKKRELVWIVKRGALETMGEYRLGGEVVSVIV